MIINSERRPELSLYYLGALFLKYLEKENEIIIGDLLEKIQSQLEQRIPIDFLYYALDWLYLLGLIKIDEGKVFYENKKINSAENTAF